MRAICACLVLVGVWNVHDADRFFTISPELLVFKITVTLAICFVFIRLLVAVIPQLALFSVVIGALLLGVVCLAVFDRTETRKFLIINKVTK